MKKFMKKMKEQAGLTLVELLAVIVILGILAAIAVPSILGIIQNTRMDAVKADAITVLNMAKLEVSSNAVKYEDLTEAGETITNTTLLTYLDGGEFAELTTANDFSVTVKPGTNGLVYELTSKEIEVGNKTIQFNGATIENINTSSNDVGTANNIIITKP